MAELGETLWWLWTLTVRAGIWAFMIGVLLGAGILAYETITGRRI